MTGGRRGEFVERIGKLKCRRYFNIWLSVLMCGHQWHCVCVYASEHSRYQQYWNQSHTTMRCINTNCLTFCIWLFFFRTSHTLLLARVGRWFVPCAALQEKKYLAMVSTSYSPVSFMPPSDASCFVPPFLSCLLLLLIPFFYNTFLGKIFLSCFPVFLSCTIFLAACHQRYYPFSCFSRIVFFILLSMTHLSFLNFQLFSHWTSSLKPTCRY